MAQLHELSKGDILLCNRTQYYNNWCHFRYSLKYEVKSVRKYSAIVIGESNREHELTSTLRHFTLVKKGTPVFNNYFE